MPALTDTVMAAVPEADAGVGSAVNDVSRKLGGALGIATIGSVVSSLYRSNVNDRLRGVIPDEMVEIVSESVGVASAIAAEAPSELAATLINGTNLAFIDSMNSGFTISAVVLGFAVVIAFTLIPKTMRSEQATAEHAVEPRELDTLPAA